MGGEHLMRASNDALAEKTRKTLACSVPLSGLTHREAEPELALEHRGSDPPAVDLRWVGDRAGKGKGPSPSPGQVLPD